MTAALHPLTNRRIVLAVRPSGVPQPEHFRRDDQPLGEPGEGEFLVRNLYLSVDPAQRGWVNASANYADPVPLGAVMRALAVGIVERSRDPRNDEFFSGHAVILPPEPAVHVLADAHARVT